MEKRKKVSIWAPLRYANYGDDMQAIAFALQIKSLGYDVKMFRLEECLAKTYQLTSCSTIEELCSEIKLCIIAGGALLTPFKWYKRLLNRAAREYEQDFKDLLYATKKFPNVKFCAISMGGDGQIRNPQKWYSESRINFFRSSAFINGTVRLSGDVEQMKQFGKCFIYYPDMLFRQGDFFEREMLLSTKKYRVVLQFKRGRYLSRQLLKDLMVYAETHDDIEFHFITTHMSHIGMTYQYIPKKTSRNVFVDHYQSPAQLTGVLASADVLVTSMLHVGLVGLTCGTPFVSYRGPGKTKSFLRSIGGDWAILGDDITFEDLKQQVFSKTREELYGLYDQGALESMKNASLSHYEFCKSIVEEYA